MGGGCLPGGPGIACCLLPRRCQWRTELLRPPFASGGGHCSDEPSDRAMVACRWSAVAAVAVPIVRPWLRFSLPRPRCSRQSTLLPLRTKRVSWWAQLDLNQGPHPYQGTSARIVNASRSNAYRRTARKRMGFGVFGCVVLGLVVLGCGVRIGCGFRSGDRLPSPEARFPGWTEAAEYEGQTN